MLRPNTRNRSVALALAAAAALLAPAATSVPATRASDELAVEVDGQLTTWDVVGVYVMPDEAIDVEVLLPAEGALKLEADGGNILLESARAWRWQAPSRGGSDVTLSLRDAAGRERMRLNAFVMLPASGIEDGVLNGYRIGAYPSEPYRGRTNYLPPKGFVEVTPSNVTRRISPHFTIGQFLCKQDDGFPKYLIVQPRLTELLERQLEALNDAGIEAETFAVLSGFRTPYYNARIGNVKYSRHQWGDAADIYVDTDRNGWMDDINGDGRSDVKDAKLLEELFERLAGALGKRNTLGGMGTYAPNAVRGSFVHVDTRGFRARWGV